MYSHSAEDRPAKPEKQVFEKNNVNSTKEILGFHEDGRPEAAYLRHPVEDIEPAEQPMVSPIFATALRYLMLQEHRSMEAVAAEIGCSRASISRALILLSDRLGIRAPCQKSQAARKHYQEARIKVVKQNRPRPEMVRAIK